MKKFNGFEKHLLTQGLEMVLEKAINEINEAIKNGKNPFYTSEYFNVMIEELKMKIDMNTKKTEK